MLLSGLKNTHKTANNLVTVIESYHSPYGTYGVDRDPFSDETRPTTEQIASIIDNLFLPSLKNHLSRDLHASSERYHYFFLDLQFIHKFFVLSRYFQEAAKEYLNNYLYYESHKNLRRSILESTINVELHSSQHIYKIFEKLSESERIQYLLKMTTPQTDFEDRIVNYERIPQIQSEIEYAQLSSDSHVVMLGCGPLPITGFGYALSGAQVTLIDRDPRAFEQIDSILHLLPKTLTDRLNFVLADTNELDLQSLHPTHIAFAGLFESKKSAIEYMSSRWSSDNNFPMLIVRSPQPNLLELYYQPLEEVILANFEKVQKSDIGIEGFNVTYFLSSKKALSV